VILQDDWGYQLYKTIHIKRKILYTINMLKTINIGHENTERHEHSHIVYIISCILAVKHYNYCITVLLLYVIIYIFISVRVENVRRKQYYVIV